MRNFHCCATCKHFAVEKENSSVRYRCSRLGFETKTTYQFHCWDPKDKVKTLMIKEKRQ